MNAIYMLPQVCTDDTWTPTSLTNAPAAREAHTAVWTGSEMIVWGGVGADYFNTGGRYDPSIDSWTATTTNNAPAGRAVHTAVWTGSEMIVWGGEFFDGVNFHYFNTGGRYNPGTNSWTATSTTNAPDARSYHTAVWTGSEMIVWGGNNPGTNTGGRYDPDTDSWTATSTTNAPSAREFHTAVWTGSEMIVWGGSNPIGLNTGGKYDPSTDSWTATTLSNAPDGRYRHTAVWTGSEMIVWGGICCCNPNCLDANTGGRYNPGIDSWTATTLINAPSGRFFHTAVWTSGEMIVCGGYPFGITGNNGVRHDAQFSVPILTPNPTPTPTPTFVTGGRYDPGTDSWTATSITNAPSARDDHTAVWSGSQMIVWGGSNISSWLNTGGRYCAQSGVTPTPTPSPAGCSAGSPACGSIIVGTAPTDFIINLSAPAEGVQGSDFMVNGTPANGATLSNGNTTITFHFNTSPAVQGQNTMHIPACAFPCGEPGGCVQEFTCTFTYKASTPTPTPTPTATPTATATATATPRIAPSPRNRPTPAPRP